MASRALQDFETRITEVQQIIDAHEALTRLRNAEGALRAGGQALGNVAHVINHLVTQPGRGRRREVHALNNAGIALLSGHLQGFIVDLYKEAAEALLNGNVQSVDAVVDAANTRGNPNPQNIIKMFKTLGFEDVFSGVSWQRMSTQALKRKLTNFNEQRNRIVHGVNERVQKQTLVNYLQVFQSFATRLDARLRAEIQQMTGTHPW